MTYKTYNQLMKERYGCKIYKLALSCSNTCPNRDGTKGFGGCIFCSEDGSGTFAQQAQDPVSVQIEKAMALVKAKNPRGYVAYFQKFTSTYRSAEELRPLFREAALHPQIRELAIATRPDCLSPEILCLLEELTRLCPVTVELGLQTAREDTARQINRCYENRVYEKAVEDLHRIGAAVVFQHQIHRAVHGRYAALRRDFLDVFADAFRIGCADDRNALPTGRSDDVIPRIVLRGQFTAHARAELRIAHLFHQRQN